MSTHTQELKNFEFGNATDIGLVRKNNEDYLGYFQIPNGHLFVVCDGMGGHKAGEKASQLTVEIFKDYFSQQYHANLVEALGKATVLANERVYQTAIKYPEFAGMGTTLVAFVIEGNSVWYVHVGDSRLYLYENQTKMLFRITRDHSFVQQLVDNGIIRQEEAETHPRKNEITRAIGVHASVEAEVSSTPILPADGDILLLCSDGLNSMLNDASIRGIVGGEQESIIQKSHRLIEEANKAGGLDNITVQLVRFYAQNRKKTIFEKKQNIPIVSSKTKTSTRIMLLALGVSAMLFGGVLAWRKSDKKSEKVILADTLIVPTEDQSKRKSIEEDSILEVKRTKSLRDSTEKADSISKKKTADSLKKVTSKKNNLPKNTQNKPNTSKAK